MVKFVIYNMLHYRKYMIDKNLLQAFPDKSEQERNEITDRYYTILSEIIVSTLILCNERKAKKIISIDHSRKGGVSEDAERLRQHAVGSSWIALTAHFGLYEYLLFWAQYGGQDLIAVYHPLKSPVVDELFRRLRNHKGVIPMPAREAMVFATRNKVSPSGKEYLIGLIADQNPPRNYDSRWYDFLGAETLFFNGGEKIALRSGLPVNFIYQSRTARGRYQLHFEPIWDGKEPLEEHEITRRYVEKLEQRIIESPEMWLWSHDRWKWKR